jgi:hypothetical protein
MAVGLGDSEDVGGTGDVGLTGMVTPNGPATTHRPTPRAIETGEVCDRRGKEARLLRS